MTIQEQDTIITGLIKEDSDNTIRDYLECMAEINGIRPRETTYKQKQMTLLIAVDKLEDKIRAEQRRNCLKRTQKDFING